MNKRVVRKVFTCFLSISFLLLTVSPLRVIAEAKETSLPIGEIVSKGDVMYEKAPNTWKRVENVHFPVFPGVKIKTAKGVATIALANGSTIEAGQQSLFSFDQQGRLRLLSGQVRFRVPSTAQTSFRIGNLSVMKSPSLQAGVNSRAYPVKNEDMIGSISINPDRSLTIDSSQGPLSVLKDDYSVFTTLSPKQSITIPSVQGVMVAQVGDPPPAGAGAGASAESGSGEFLGISTWGWVGIGLGVAAAVGIGVGIAVHENNEDEHGRTVIPVCP